MKNSGYSLEARGSPLKTAGSSPKWYQNFRFEAGYFTNVRNNKVFEVDGAKDVEG